jgi:hypothetical protein
VRAFLVAEPLDEFLAHIMAIEAAVGLETDYKKRGATERVAARVSALLGAKTAGDDYTRVFDLRSAFLHGRRMNAIPGTGSIRLGSLFLTLPTRGLTGQDVMTSDG